MNAALQLADAGFTIYLVEKESELGGSWRATSTSTIEGGDVRAYLEELISEVQREELVTVLTGHEVVDVDGFVGQVPDPGARRPRAGRHCSSTGRSSWPPAAGEYEPDG